MTKEIRTIRNYLDKADKETFNSIMNHGWIAGGAVRAACARESIKDVDVFFYTHNDRLALEVELIDQGFTQVVSSDNANTYTKNDVCVQTIKKEYDNAWTCIDTFDFTVTMAFVQRVPAANDFSNDIMETSHFFYQDLAARELRVNRKLQYPLNTAVRMVKYLKKGYTIRPVELVQLLIQCAKLNPQTLPEWKEQLLGIDMITLGALFATMENEGTTQLNADSLMDCIDREVDKRLGDEE